MASAKNDDQENARDEYLREGYLRRPGFFADEIALLAALIDRDKRRLLEREDVTIDSHGGEASNLGYLGHGDDVITSFAATARLVNLVSELLADQVYLIKGRLTITWGDDARA